MMAIDSAHKLTQAVWNFVEFHNSEWRVEKNSFSAPREIRQNWQENYQAAKANLWMLYCAENLPVGQILCMVKSTVVIVPQITIWKT